MLNTGIVSNCWNFYLQNGVKLRELVAHAADLQMRDIEFRQGSLGDLEPSRTSGCTRVLLRHTITVVLITR